MSQILRSAGAVPPTRTLLSAIERQRRLHRHIFLWAMQIGLAMFFAGAGYAKLTEAPDLLGHLVGWTTIVSAQTVRTAGWFEIAVAVGMLAPLVSWRLRLAVRASALATCAQTALMIIFHGLEASAKMSALHLQLAIVNILLLLMAVAILAGRASSPHVPVEAGRPRPRAAPSETPRPARPRPRRLSGRARADGYR